MNEARKKVEKVNRQLIELGYSWKDIKRFWDDCIKESKDKIRKEKLLKNKLKK